MPHLVCGKGARATLRGAPRSIAKKLQGMRAVCFLSVGRPLNRSAIFADAGGAIQGGDARAKGANRGEFLGGSDHMCRAQFVHAFTCLHRPLKLMQVCARCRALQCCKTVAPCSMVGNQRVHRRE